MALDKDDIKQLIAILQKGLIDEIVDEDEPFIKTESKIKNKKTKISQKKQTNKFVELGFDKLHKEDIAIDKLLNKNPPTKRSRKFNLVKVQCRVCGKQEQINPSLLYESQDRYKCNKCCSSPG